MSSVLELELFWIGQPVIQASSLLFKVDFWCLVIFLQICLFPAIENLIFIVVSYTV